MSPVPVRRVVADGAFSQATFNHPQGMALDGPYLYVADTENHLIRRLDLRKRVVETLLGTGQQAQEFNVPGVGREVAINSPWDVAVVDRRLYIAMAGFHQIWELNLDNMEAQPFAGSGREDVADGATAGSSDGAAQWPRHRRQDALRRRQRDQLDSRRRRWAPSQR